MTYNLKRMEHVAANILWQLGTIFMRYIPPQEKNHVRFKQLEEGGTIFICFTPRPQEKNRTL